MPPLWHGGRGEIRTPGCLATSPDFESGALVHSATLPQFSRESAFQNLTGIVCFVQFFRATSSFANIFALKDPVRSADDNDQGTDKYNYCTAREIPTG